MSANGKLRAAAVAGLLWTGFHSAFSQNWTLTSAPITNWIAVAMSADGSKLVAAGRGPYNGNDGYPAGPVYYSADSGVSWIQTSAPIEKWTSVAASAEGTRLVASAGDGFESALYVSTNSGSSWLDRTPISTWPWVNLLAVACSADAEILVAVSGVRMGYTSGSQAFVSTNMGETWTVTNLSEVATSVACSADGKRIIAGAVGNLFVATFDSTNSGATWRERYGPGNWESVDCSAEGTRLMVASGYGSAGSISLSTDAGDNWSQITNSVAVGWGGTLALSADGSQSALAVDANLGGPILTSADSGVTWTQTDAPITNWMSIACSADGNRLAAVVGHAWPNGGGIYTSQTTPTPVLNITPAGSGLRISWIVPSMPFVLQENADLNTPNWTAVPVTPILNLTNLHHEVTVPLSGTNRFYRLKNL